MSTNVRGAVVIAAALLAGCSRGGPPPEPVVPTPTPSPSQPAVTEAATEAVEVSGPLEELLVIPEVSDSDHWAQLGSPGQRTTFEEWLSARQVKDEARTIAEQMDADYGFRREAEVRFVHRVAAGNGIVRTRQLLISHFDHADEQLSEVWCSIDDESAKPVQLGSSARVQAAVEAITSLPNSCGAVHRAPAADGFQADINFRHGPLMIQVVAVEPKPIEALEALAETVPAVYSELVERTSPGEAG